MAVDKLNMLLYKMMSPSRIGIFYDVDTKNKAEEIYNYILENFMDKLDSKRSKKSKYEMMIYFKNEDIIRFVSLSDQSRGQAFTNSIVLGNDDSLIRNRELINCIVRPCTKVGFHPEVFLETGERYIDFCNRVYKEK